MAVSSAGRVAVVLAAVALALGGCARSLLGDAHYHAGVARAHAMPVQGIDVSRWQGAIDWQAVKRSGIDFAFIKATEGGDHLDPRFHENWEASKRAGVLRGAYHFVYWCRPIHAQALWFVLNVPADPDALPPVLDLEWTAPSDACPTRPTAAEARAMSAAILHVMEEFTGRRPIIYTDINFHRDVLAGHFPDHSFWLRSVAAEPHAVYQDRDWTFWQFTTTGRVAGIEGNVDRNVFAGTRAEWAAWVASTRRRAGRRRRLPGRSDMAPQASVLP